MVVTLVGRCSQPWSPRERTETMNSPHSMIVLSKDAQTLLEEFHKEGKLTSAPGIYRQPMPPHRWWAAVSKGAKSGQPYFEAMKEIMAAHLEEPNLPLWPTGLYETEESLPPILQDDALAILDRFLHAEAGKLVPGVQLHDLHWDVLAAQYCPLRERYGVLRELAARGFLAEAAAGITHAESRLQWPLTITESAVREIRKSRIQARLPMISRVEETIANVVGAYPNTTKALVWVVVGGGLVKLADFVISILK